MKSFIETQLPVSKLSKECYKERKANYSQTLTGLGKWWGRKPLILVRATIVGLLMPASKDPKKDREIYLKILTMDDEGLMRRRTKLFTKKELLERISSVEAEQLEELEIDIREEPDAKTKKELKAELARFKVNLQDKCFRKLSYDKKLTRCDRPEQIEGPSEKAWEAINAHLDISATCLNELVQQLGEKRFGHVPRVGDAFCGGGSIPFEAARIGCEAYGSDLNPVAALLTWASLNIIGGESKVAEEIRNAQEKVYAEVDRQITEWGIEHKAPNVRADAYLYCVETRCPETGWLVPLAPSWIIGEKTMTVAKMVPDYDNKRYSLEIKMDATLEEMQEAKQGTVSGGKLVHPLCDIGIPITMIRGDRPDQEFALRLWENEDVVPRPDDVFQERLYCIRWVETYTEWDESKQEEVTKIRKYYAAPDEEDLQREAKVLSLLQERFHEWQDTGFTPSMQIERGYNTDQPIRERGWTHWHHLFNPRQLLIHGMLLCKAFSRNEGKALNVGFLLGGGKCADWDSRLTRWDSSSANERVAQTFYNQALNTLCTYANRGFLNLKISWMFRAVAEDFNSGNNLVQPCDAREISSIQDIWITDPPYANAVNYHELCAFFLAWYDKLITHTGLDWYSEGKSALAVKGKDTDFKASMIDCYKTLDENTFPAGYNVVMFTHQDAGVWADLALILWASGLKVSCAWCISTETDTALKQGNYVQGTVLLVLQKQTSEEQAYLDEIYPEVEAEVKNQLDNMIALEDAEDPNFSDTDYQLAAYAAALRVLTSYESLEDIDVSYELSKTRKKGEQSPVEKIIEQAVKVACDHLVPQGFDTFTWKTLSADERFFLKGLELQSHDEFRSGAYQELARGFGIRDYKFLLGKTTANQTRLHTASTFGKKHLGDSGFGNSLLRHCLFAVREVVVAENDAAQGKNWFHAEVAGYWENRKTIIELLNYLARLEHVIPEWQEDGAAARLLSGIIENDTPSGF